jgi:hypothetical protein
MAGEAARLTALFAGLDDFALMFDIVAPGRSHAP